jgi:hypothetical protein
LAARRHRPRSILHTLARFVPSTSSSIMSNSRIGLVISMATLALSACGGGGADDGSAQPLNVNAPISTTANCPAGYRSIRLQDANTPNASYSMADGDAMFSFKMPPATAPQPSVLVCMGKPASALAQGGYYVLSDTVELTGTPLAALSSGLLNLYDRELQIKFALSNLPAGTSTVDMVNKIKVFAPDANGMWQPQPQSAITLTLATPDQKASTIAAGPNLSGKFVVAYRP